MSRRQIEYACKRLGVNENVTLQDLDKAYKALVQSSQDSDLDELYTLYSFMKDKIKSNKVQSQSNFLINPAYNAFNPYHSFDNMLRQMNYIHDMMLENSMNMMNSFGSHLIKEDIQDIQDIQEKQDKTNISGAPKLYQRRFVKEITVNNGKTEMKTYKEINKNGNRFYEEKIDDGDKTKIKRIVNGDVKEFTKDSILNKKSIKVENEKDDGSDNY